MTHFDFLARLDGAAQAELVRRGELQASDLIEACASRLEAVDRLLHAVVEADLDRAMARAKGGLSGPFAGVPFLVKDIAAYPGLRHSMGSRLFRGNVAPQGSPFTDRIDQAGLVTVGKSATSELGLLGSTETLLEGVTHNPWDLSYSAAGSSGGAASAVAAGLVPLAHASDGGGSIRVPASVCGLFGLKPSRGRCAPSMLVRSDFGDLTNDLCVSRSVRDTALFLSLTEAGGEGAELSPVGYVEGPSKARLTIGAWATTLLGAEPEPEVRAAFEQAASLCESLGHRVVVASPPRIDGKALSDAFFAVAGAAMAGMAQMMAGMLGRPVGRRELEPFTWALIDDFASRGPAALEAARATFAAASACYLEATAGFDVVLTPTLATLPWRLGELSPVKSREELIARTERSVGYTPIHNIAGCPAMSVPLAWSAQGLPIGLHFAAARGAEATLLALAYELEEARPWAGRWAPWSLPVLWGG